MVRSTNNNNNVSQQRQAISIDNLKEDILHNVDVILTEHLTKKLCIVLNLFGFYLMKIHIHIYC